MCGTSAGQRRPSAANRITVLAALAAMPATGVPTALYVLTHHGRWLLESAYWTVVSPFSQIHQACGANSAAHVTTAQYGAADRKYERRLGCRSAAMKQEIKKRTE